MPPLSLLLLKLYINKPLTPFFASWEQVIPGSYYVLCERPPKRISTNKSEPWDMKGNLSHRHQLCLPSRDEAAQTAISENMDILV